MECNKFWVFVDYNWYVWFWIGELGVCKLGEEFLVFDFENGVVEELFDDLFDEDVKFDDDINGRFWSGVEDNWF